MFSRVFSGDISGVDARLVCVEADVAGGLPQFQMVGLLSSEVREARERVSRAFSNSQIDLPARKITVNLSPAGVKKQGSGFDLPIAVSILTAFGVIREDAVRDKLFIGELSLDGHINKVKGILPVAAMAKAEGIPCLVVPADNIQEAAVIDGIRVFGVRDLKELIEGLNQNTFLPAQPVDLEAALKNAYDSEEIDYADIKGQEKAKRATEIAVAGFHNLMYIGPPGSGKSMLARRIPTILGCLTREECLEISKIYSVMGLLPPDSVVLKRPFRDPHHSITAQALIGGSANPKPGEITLAHKGVLFLDEAGEFKKDVIEMLRQPLEEKQVVISRMNANVVFPSDFMLVLAMNPCPCGFYPDRQHCSCSMQEVNRYFGKVKGPVLDRIDICVGTSKLETEQLEQGNSESSRDMRARIQNAQNIQKRRFSESGILFNSQMSGKEIHQFCALREADKRILDKAYRKYNMSARGYFKVIRVARTIADLEGCENINGAHLMEAIGYRNTYDN